HEKLGVAKDTAGYGLKFEDLEMPESMRASLDGAGLDEFLAWARENGFTKKQVEAMVHRAHQKTQASQDEAAARAAQAESRAWDEAAAEMQKAWGPETKKHLAIVQRGVKEQLGPAFAAC